MKIVSFLKQKFEKFFPKYSSFEMSKKIKLDDQSPEKGKNQCILFEIKSKI